MKLTINLARVVRFSTFFLVTGFSCWAWFDAYPETLKTGAIVGIAGFLLIGYALSALVWRGPAPFYLIGVSEEQQEEGGMGLLDWILILVGMGMIWLGVGLTG